MLNLLRIAIILKANESVEHMKNCTTVDAAVDFHSCLLHPTSKFLVFSQKKQMEITQRTLCFKVRQ
mgnify:CR=1